MTVPTQAVAPQPVVVSYWLYIVGAVLGLIGLIITLVTLPAAITLAQQQLVGTPAANQSGVIVGAAIGAGIFSAVLSVAFAVVMIIFARKMLVGRNWARIVLAVLAGLQIFGVVGAYGVGALHFLVLAAAAIFSFLPLSNAYFRSLAAGRSATV